MQSECVKYCFSPQENKIHIFKPLGNFLFIMYTFFILTLPAQTLSSGLLIFRGKKAKFSGIFRGKFAEKSADFTGFSREKVKIRSKIGRFCGIFVGDKSKFAEKSADFVGF